MEFAIMVWKSRDVRASSIFCVFDKIKPGILPQNFPKRTLGPSRNNRRKSVKDAEAAKKSISEFGYYLTGGEQASRRLKEVRLPGK
jgi:hypothetical protein